MLINVKQEHLDKGGLGFCNCPVALAIKEVINKPVVVSYCFIRIGTEPIHTPLAVYEFIRKWDSLTEDLKPFSFDLDYPCSP